MIFKEPTEEDKKQFEKLLENNDIHFAIRNCGMVKEFASVILNTKVFDDFNEEK